MAPVQKTPARKTAQAQRQRQPKPQSSPAKNNRIASRHTMAKKTDFIDLTESDDEDSVKKEDPNHLTIVPAKRHKSSASQGLDSDRYVSGDKRHQTSPAQSAKRDVSSSPERPAGWAMTKSPAGRKRRQSKKPVPAAKDVEYEGRYKEGNKYAVNRFGFQSDRHTLGKIEGRTRRTSPKNPQGAGVTKKASPKTSKAVNAAGGSSKQTSAQKSVAGGANTGNATTMRDAKETGRYARIGDSYHFYPDMDMDEHSVADPKKKDHVETTSQATTPLPVVKSENATPLKMVPAVSTEPEFDIEKIPAGHWRRKTERLIRAFPHVSPRYLYQVLEQVQWEIADAQELIRLDQAQAQAKVEDEDIKMVLADDDFTWDQDGIDPVHLGWSPPVKPSKVAKASKA